MTLSDYLARENLTLAEFGAKIGATAQAVHRYTNGERIPRRAIMQRIVAATGGDVVANDFFHAPPKRPRKRAA